jgi:hypothetical protein
MIDFRDALQIEQWAAMYFAAFLAFGVLPFLLEFAIGPTIAWLTMTVIFGLSFFSTSKYSFSSPPGKPELWRTK